MLWRALFSAAALDVLPGVYSGAAGLPQLRGGFPRLGDRGYALAVGSGRALSPGALLVGAVAPAAVPGACALRVAPVVSLPFATTALGAAQVTLPIPPQPSLLGVALGTQAAVADAAGGLLGVASLTDGLRLVIGR